MRQKKCYPFTEIYAHTRSCDPEVNFDQLLSYNLESSFWFLPDISRFLKPNIGLTCIKFNIKSLPKNYGQFVKEFDCGPFEVVEFTETWLTYMSNNRYIY